MHTSLSRGYLLCTHAGNTGYFHGVLPPPCVRAVARRLRVAFHPFFGRAGLPLPLPVKLLVVVGRPIYARPGEDADALHARYCDALAALFDAHKGRLGATWADKTLRVM
jgi:hypothetical protein